METSTSHDHLVQKMYTVYCLARSHCKSVVAHNQYPQCKVLQSQKSHRGTNSFFEEIQITRMSIRPGVTLTVMLAGFPYLWLHRSTQFVHVCSLELFRRGNILLHVVSTRNAMQSHCGPIEQASPVFRLSLQPVSTNSSRLSIRPALTLLDS